MDIEILQVARVAHEVNRAYCAALGDHSQKPWAEAEQWQRDSAVSGVLAALSGTAQTPESLQSLHESWMAEKVAAGWVFGYEKDAERKTHPCLVQRAKDYLFRGVIEGFRAL